MRRSCLEIGARHVSCIDMFGLVLLYLLSASLFDCVLDSAISGDKMSFSAIIFEIDGFAFFLCFCVTLSDFLVLAFFVFGL